MNRIGADTFRQRMVQCFNLYDQKNDWSERIIGVPAGLSATPEEWLECHARCYVIDHILAGLGWQLPTDVDFSRHLQSLGIEYPVRSLQSGHRRFLDYLGFERISNTPLLVVEAKRPSQKLPVEGPWSGHISSHPVASLFAEYLRSIAASERLDTSDIQLGRDWRKYLNDLRDYARSMLATSESLRRVVITNGDWLIVFHSPKETLGCISDDIRPADIVVYDSRDSLLEHYDDVFSRLSYVRVAKNVGIVKSHTLSSLVAKDDVTHAMFGMRVLYCRDQKLYAQVPRMEVAPILHVCSGVGTTISVESTKEVSFEIAIGDDAQIDVQRDEIAEAANALKQDVEHALGMDNPIPLRNLDSHYADSAAFNTCPGVRELSHGSRDRQFILVTGNVSHFLIDPNEFGDCPYHDSRHAIQDSVLHEKGRIHEPCVTPRAYFADGSVFHCSHRQTDESKSIALSSVNRSRTGVRSGRDGEVFCEILQLDEFLCCRSCAFYTTCARSDLFLLPCPTLS